MKMPGAGYLGLLVGLLAASTPVSALQHRPLDPVETVINTCADFDIGSPYELTGTTTVLETVSCSPRVVVHVKEANAVLRSDKTLETHGLHVVVHREAKLTIAAPAVNMHRAKGDAKKGTLLIVKGQLDFELTGWTPAFLLSSMDDTGRTIKVGPRGAIRSDEAIKFTEDSIVVVARSTWHEGEFANAADLRSANRAEENRAVDDARDDTAASSSDSGTSERSADYVDDVYRNPTSSPPPATPEVDGVPVGGPRDKKTSTAGLASGRLANDPNLYFGGPFRKASLNSGESVVGRIFSVDETAAVYACTISGFIRHARSTRDAPADAEGPRTGSSTTEYATLVASNAKKVARVYQLRADNTEQQEQLRASAKLLAVRKWLLWGKHGIMEERARRRSKEHMHHVYMTLTNRGRVEVYMDGIMVLRVSGPSILGYRPRDPTYELRATRRGMEIYRRGKLDWSVEAYLK